MNNPLLIIFCICVVIIFITALSLATIFSHTVNKEARIQIKPESIRKTYHVPVDGFFRPGEHLQLRVVGAVASSKDLVHPSTWFYSLDGGEKLTVVAKDVMGECQIQVPDVFTTSMIFIAQNEKRKEFARSLPVSVTPELQVQGPKETLLVNQMANFVVTSSPSVMKVLQCTLQTSTDDGKTWADETKRVTYSSTTHALSWIPSDPVATMKIRIRSSNLVGNGFPVELSAELPGDFSIVAEHPSKTPTDTAGTLLSKMLIHDAHGDVKNSRFTYGEDIRVTWETTAPGGTKLQLQWSTSSSTGFVDLLTDHPNASNQSVTATLPSSTQVPGSQNSEVSIYLKLVVSEDVNEWIVSSPVVLLPTNMAWSFDDKAVLPDMYASSFHVPFFFPGATQEIADTSNWKYELKHGDKGDPLSEGFVLSLVFLDTPGAFEMHFGTDKPETIDWVLPASAVKVDDIQVSMAYGTDGVFQVLSKPLVLGVPGDIPLEPWGKNVEIGFLGTSNQMGSFLEFSESSLLTGGDQISLAYRSADLKDFPVAWQLVFPEQKDPQGNPYVMAFDVTTRSEDGNGTLSAVRIPSTLMGNAKVRISPAGFPQRYVESLVFSVQQLLGLGQAPEITQPAQPSAQAMAGEHQVIPLYGVYDQTIPFLTQYDMRLSLEYAVKPRGSTDFPVDADFKAADFGADFTSDASGYKLVLSEAPTPVILPANQVYFRAKAVSSTDTSVLVTSTFTYTAYTTPTEIPSPGDLSVSYTLYSTGDSSKPVSSVVIGDQLELLIKSGVVPDTSGSVQVLAVKPSDEDDTKMEIMDGFDVSLTVPDSKSILLDTTDLGKVAVNFSTPYRFLLVFGNASCYTTPFTLDPSYKASIETISTVNTYRFQASLWFYNGGRNLPPYDFEVTFNFNATSSGLYITGDRKPITVDLSERPDFTDNPLIEDVVVDKNRVYITFKPLQKGGGYFPIYNPFTIQANVASDLFSSWVVHRKKTDSSLDVSFTSGLGLTKLSMNSHLALAYAQSLPEGTWGRIDGTPFLDDDYNVLRANVLGPDSFFQKGADPSYVYPDMDFGGAGDTTRDHIYSYVAELRNPLLPVEVTPLKTACEQSVRVRWLHGDFDIYTGSGATMYITSFMDHRYTNGNTLDEWKIYYRYPGSFVGALPADWCITNKYGRTHIYGAAGALAGCPPEESIC